MPAALVAARLSPDSRGWRMIDFPCASPAMVTALMVCDLLVGIRTSPRSVDFSLIILMSFYSTSRYSFGTWRISDEQQLYPVTSV